MVNNETIATISVKLRLLNTNNARVDCTQIGASETSGKGCAATAVSVITLLALVLKRSALLRHAVNPH